MGGAAIATLGAASALNAEELAGTPPFGNTECAADRFNGNLNCTANDGGVAGVTVTNNINSCVEGSTIFLNLNLTANSEQPDRRDLGLFVGTTGENPQLTSANGGPATCTVFRIPGPPFPGDATNLDGDDCPDLPGPQGNSANFTVTGVQLTCTPDANGEIFFPVLAAYSQNDGAVCSSINGTVPEDWIQPGTSSKCSFGNVDTNIVVGDLGTLTVDKVTSPAQDPTLFNFDVTGLPSEPDPPNPPLGIGPADFDLADQTAPQVVGLGVIGNVGTTGPFTLTETETGGFQVASIVCRNNVDQTIVAQNTDQPSITFSLTNAQKDVTCTVTNTIPATLTLVKEVTNDDGGTAVAADWTLTAQGPETITGASGSAEVTNQSVTPGTYALSEQGPAGYTPGNWVCNAGQQDGANITLAGGDVATCTITNDDQAATLTLEKTVINDDGGTASTADFTLSADGPTPISGVSGDPAVTGVSVDAGVYTLTETTVLGYTAGAWSCPGFTLGGANNNELTLGLGQTATCTIVNNDQAPTLTLVKTVVNDDGGTATTASFTLTATGPTTISGVSGSPAVTNATVDSGTYVLTETTVTGYTAGTWSCPGFELGGAGGNELTLGLGDTATCTIINDDVAPTLTLVKQITNDDGGSAVLADFTLTATGPTTISGTSGSPAVTNAAVDAGQYTLTETVNPNYSASAWSCPGFTLTGGNLNVLTLGVGQTATCTITNDDLPPSLTLTKTVTNDNGGTATIANFTLTATGPVTISGTSGSAAVTGAEVPPGDYTLSESTVSGYTPGNWQCTGGSLNGNVVTVPASTVVSCNIVNDDQAANLTLTKTVVNDNTGAAIPANFTLTATGPTTISGTTGSGTVTGASVSAGSYTLTETGPGGYTLQLSCQGGSLVGNVLTIGNGQTVSCTFTNNDVFVAVSIPTLGKGALIALLLLTLGLGIVVLPRVRRGQI